MSLSQKTFSSNEMLFFHILTMFLISDHHSLFCTEKNDVWALTKVLEISVNKFKEILYKI